MTDNHWKKSSYSQGGDANCVECRTEHRRVLLRDTQHRHLGHLALPVNEWAAFLTDLRSDQL